MEIYFLQSYVTLLLINIILYYVPRGATKSVAIKKSY